MNPHHFPDHLIYKVLSRLPTKSVIRFRCVSKTWNSLIYDPYFLQLRRSINRTNNLFLFVCPNPCEWGNEESSNPNVFLGHVPIDEDQGYLELNSSTRILSMPDLLCEDLDVQSVNGLLCFNPKRNWLWKWFSSQHASFTTHIFNPTTRQVVTLPHDNTIDFYPEYSLLTHFGYDPLGDKFKVLRVILNNKDFQKLRILTVGDYVWRNIVTPPCDHHLMSNLKDIGTCINGAIHWLDHTHKVITVFDVGTEQFKQIPIFDDGLLLKSSAILVECGGYLSLVRYYTKMELLDLSILKDYENNVWIHERIILPDGHIPMNMTKQGYYELVCRVYTQEIMFLRYFAFNNPFKVYYYDTKTRSCRSILLMEVAMPLSRDLDFGGVQLFAYQENFKRL